MSEFPDVQLYFQPTARTTDPETSHEAAKRVRPGGKELVDAIRAVVKAYGPMTSWEIAELVELLHPGRWAPDTIRTGCARAGLEKSRMVARSPRGNPCGVYRLPLSAHECEIRPVRVSEVL